MDDQLLFFIGPNKTGSNSIEKFLINNNFNNVCHLGKNSVKEKYRIENKINYDIDFELINKDNFLINYIEENIKKGFNCFIDLWDLFNLVPYLVNKYKNAKFIFNDRNIKNWIISRKKAVSNNYLTNRSWNLLEEKNG